ncbi:hypothetical protein CVT26_002982 [Gymnopilus dilepis]|uniref:Uncharacterized protein n=1 Tax=Gymnopilus dilepis TaxID=231916 RepID=A0A409Y4I4_9AGAR|nr:hypothetical protein CVT26_002982 [Gymnopilus dilepis]
MGVSRSFKRFMLTLLSLFTVYDAVLQAIELPMVGGEILLRELAHRQRNALMIIIPLSTWHIYNAEVPSASWSLSLVLVIWQTMYGVDCEMLMVRSSHTPTWS